MSNACEREIIQMAVAEIKKFSKKWAKSPYRWESEADIHAELYMRIKLRINKKFPPSKHACFWEENGKIKTVKEVFDWVYCKPKTYIKGDKNNCYYPDIAIYKENTGNCLVKERKNVPMLWLCEIKYITEWSSLLSKENVENDIKKLTQLLNQKKDGTDRACYLIFQRNISGKNIYKILKRRDKRVKLLYYPKVKDEK